MDNLKFTEIKSKIENFDSLPYISRVFVENILRNAPILGDAVVSTSLQAIVRRDHTIDFPFYPARVVLQDLLGTPALVDLAGMRDAVAEAGGDPSKVNPVVPTQLVVDHSLNVEVAGSVPDAMKQNMVMEQAKNTERFEFLAWCKKAFSNLDIIMPGSGILHQINIERMSPVIQVKDGIAYPDSLVGTDSHTTMINALGVVGWGVGGLEAESVMLGRAVWMRLPQLVKVELTGQVRPNTPATDVVLALTEFLRAQNVVGSILEFHGAGVQHLALADRATISNMCPEFGATAAIFAIDDKTLTYLHTSGREQSQIDLVETYAKAQGLWADAFTQAQFDRSLQFDLSSVELCLAGPSDPHQRRPLSSLKAQGIALANPVFPQGGAMPEGAVVIAAITSCTNTSNPRSMIAAGLLAQKAVARGMVRQPWVKTSLAPGSQVVEHYLREANLLAPLAQLGFGIVGFGCTSCNGMSGPLAPAIEQEILARNLHTTGVLSGNRNFDGRVHPRVKEAYLASPALVVAYAIAGSIRVDVAHDALALDAQGKPVKLSDLWPSDAEIDALMAQALKPEQFRSVYDAMFVHKGEANAKAQAPVQYPWNEQSNYIRRPPYWQDQFTALSDFQSMRPLGVFGDNITTDHLSPSGAILPESAAGEFLMGKGIEPANFNSYGTRRGDHVVAIRATFASPRLKNEMVLQGGVIKEGSLTRLEPEGHVMRLYEAAEIYLARKQDLIVVAGKNYGAGSSRDWAAKGVRLLGVKAVVCENFERIHRQNLVGMGILPLEFQTGESRKTFGIDGSEVFKLNASTDALKPGSRLQLTIQRKNGETTLAEVICRIDTEEERLIFTAGGLLPRMKAEFLK